MRTLFNHPESSSRSAKPWQPTGRLAPEHTRHGFASTEWLRLEDADFADGGYKPEAADFSQDRYQARVIPLSDKSRTSLQLMGETEHLISDEATASTAREPESPNAHLPFVLDVYGVKPAAKKLPQVLQATELDAQVSDADAQAAFAHDELEDEPTAESCAENEADEIERTQAADEAVAEPQEAQSAFEVVAEHEVEPELEPEACEALSQHDTATESQPETEPDHQVASAPHSELEQEVQVEPDWAESELIADDNAQAPQALAAEIDEVLAQVAVPAEAVTGIDPEEVAQREAAQFAEGLAQGIAQGERQAREAMQQEVAAQCAVLSAVTHDLNALLQDPKKFFEPLKRLALHVAEHVVMKELSTSTDAVERLVQRCLDELDHPAQGAVVVELSPQDKERLQAQGSALVAGMRLDAVPSLKPGSVRLFANDTVVEDLVEHRLEALARSLLVDVQAWQDHSLFAQSDVENSESEVQDVEPDDVHP